MSGITVLSGDVDLEQKVVTIFGRKVAVRRVWSQQWRDSAEVSMDACAADPELLIIGPDLPLEVVRYVVADVDRQFRSTTTAVLINNPEVQVSMDLLRLGAREVLPTGLDESKLQAKLDPVLQLAQERHDRADGERVSLRRRVITVISPKGGTGKTTLATNLAIGLASQVPKQVLLVDLDLQFGDCASALGLKPEHSLTEAIQATSHERSGLKVFLTSHPSGLLMLPPPDDLAAADNVDVDDLKTTVSALAEEFPFVVIDTAAGIDSAALVAMQLATDLLFVTTTDVPSILAVRRQVEALDRIGFTSQRRSLVLNRANAKVGLSASDVESSIGMEAKFQIPSSRLIPVSTNEGSPAILKETGNMARKFEEIALYFAPNQDDDRSRSLLRGFRRDR
ncbi:MAG: AAA family ATPase [Acidimicrobiia bacterium]|nr:AAA family ATPase [Acidimicrobiia bacterium]